MDRLRTGWWPYSTISWSRAVAVVELTAVATGTEGRRCCRWRTPPSACLATLRDGVEGDEAEAGRRVPGVVGGGAVRRACLGRIDEAVAVARCLAIRSRVDRLDLGLADEAPQRIGRAPASKPPSGPSRTGGSRRRLLKAVGGGIATGASSLTQPVESCLEGGDGRLVALNQGVVVAVRDVAGDVETGGRERQRSSAIEEPV